MAGILLTVLIISYFDLRQIIKEKQPKVIVVFIFLALGSLIYGYYFTTHIYTASIIGVILTILKLE